MLCDSAQKSSALNDVIGTSEGNGKSEDLAFSGFELFLNDGLGLEFCKGNIVVKDNDMRLPSLEGDCINVRAIEGNEDVIFDIKSDLVVKEGREVEFFIESDRKVGVDSGVLVKDLELFELDSQPCGLLHELLT